MGVGFDHRGERGYKVFAFRSSIKDKPRILTSHRMVFYLTYGYFPDEVDHIDNNKSNNQPSNLRAATRLQNSRNNKSYKNSTCVYLGVSKHSQCERWQADIRVQGKGRYLGLFKTAKEAASHYNLAAMEHFGEFANYNDVR